jgi:hypothetical protein
VSDKYLERADNLRQRNALVCLPVPGRFCVVNEDHEVVLLALVMDLGLVCFASSHDCYLLNRVQDIRSEICQWFAVICRFLVVTKLEESEPKGVGNSCSFLLVPSVIISFGSDVILSRIIKYNTRYTADQASQNINRSLKLSIMKHDYPEEYQKSLAYGQDLCAAPNSIPNTGLSSFRRTSPPGNFVQ